MRWVLAGLAFALLVGLAVFTVAMKTRNIALRHRIAVLEQHLVALRVERGRRDPGLVGRPESQALIQRLQELLGAARVAEE